LKPEEIWPKLLPYLPTEQPFAICFFGLPGTGKTTHARLTLEYFRKKREKISYLNSDLLRQHLFSPTYSLSESLLLYEIIARLAEILLDVGYSLILDATGTHPGPRWNIQKVLKGEAKQWLEIVTIAPPEVIRQRLSQRKFDPPDPFTSQATIEVYEKFLQQIIEDPRRDPASDSEIPMILFSTTDGQVEIRNLTQFPG
jgi:predicted kinase